MGAAEALYRELSGLTTDADTRFYEISITERWPEGLEFIEGRLEAKLAGTSAEPLDTWMIVPEIAQYFGRQKTTVAQAMSKLNGEVEHRIRTDHKGMGKKPKEYHVTDANAHLFEKKRGKKGPSHEEISVLRSQLTEVQGLLKEVGSTRGIDLTSRVIEYTGESVQVTLPNGERQFIDTDKQYVFAQFQNMLQGVSPDYFTKKRITSVWQELTQSDDTNGKVRGNNLLGILTLLSKASPLSSDFYQQLSAESGVNYNEIPDLLENSFPQYINRTAGVEFVWKDKIPILIGDLREKVYGVRQWEPVDNSPKEDQPKYVPKNKGDKEATEDGSTKIVDPLEEVLTEIAGDSRPTTTSGSRLEVTLPDTKQEKPSGPVAPKPNKRSPKKDEPKKTIQLNGKPTDIYLNQRYTPAEVQGFLQILHPSAFTPRAGEAVIDKYSYNRNEGVILGDDLAPVLENKLDGIMLLSSSSTRKKLETGNVDFDTIERILKERFPEFYRELPKIVRGPFIYKVEIEDWLPQISQDSRRENVKGKDSQRETLDGILDSLREKHNYPRGNNYTLLQRKQIIPSDNAPMETQINGWKAYAREIEGYRIYNFMHMLETHGWSMGQLMDQVLPLAVEQGHAKDLGPALGRHDTKFYVLKEGDGHKEAISKIKI